jgi:hypothetical protein
MAKPRLINGLPHDLVQSFFSTLRYWEKGYMSDWVVNAAQGLKIHKIRIDIINKTIDPKDIEIKPIIFNINELDKIIDKALINAGLTRNFIKQAYFDIDIFDDRYLKCQTIIIAENGKKYQAKDYIEKSFEIFKAVKLNGFDRFCNLTEKKYFRIRFILFGRLINRKLKYTKRLENMMQ